MNFIVTYFRGETPLCSAQVNTLTRAKEIAKIFQSQDVTHAKIFELGRSLGAYLPERRET